MAVMFPGSHNVFVPNHEATNKLVVDFSRNPTKFPINRYCQIVPVGEDIGLYLKMTVEQAGRITEADLSDLVWPDGNDAPSGADGTESFEFLQYRTTRYSPHFRFGWKTKKNASWDIVAQHAAIHSARMMTARTQKVATLLQTAGNWDSSHTSAVASITHNSVANTGKWSESTSARQDIKRSLAYAKDIIKLDTLSVVQPEDLILVMGPALAQSISQTQEIIDLIKQSPYANAYLSNKMEGPNAQYGLPPELYGVPLVVDDTSKVTNAKGATRAASFVWGGTVAALVSRPGGLIGVAGAPSFSTATLFCREEEEMAVEQWEDVNNKRTLGRVIDTFDEELTAPAAGFLFTSCA